jgi:hypothetical protein
MGSPIGLASIDFTEFKQSWRVLVLSIVGVAISINAALLYGFGTLVIPSSRRSAGVVANCRWR